jgi:hypothetical protein
MTTLSAAWELQKAAAALIVADSALGALIKGSDGRVRIFDDVPPPSGDGDQSAFVLLGDGEETNIGGECLPGSSHAIALTVCSANVGFKSAKLIAQALRDCLDGADVVIAGFESNSLTWRSTSHRRHPDQATLRQSIVVFDIELRPDH